MAAKSFLRIVTGRITEIVATVISAGAGNDGDIVALDATGRLDTSVMPVGIGADTASITASENLSAGDFVNVWDSSGTIKVRKADATAAGKESDGFVLSSATSGNPALVYFEGTNTQLTSLTLGARYYLDSTAGAAVATTPPSASGNVVQYLGRAISATALSFEPSEGVILA